ncbi:CCDC90 family protein (plasmid) [Erwinia tracheiphila]|uniref:CCDC90 family protein n=1 Tax=Erwinia tracheiphila TaxID=65700 RepID=UPI001F41E643|nr:CCDC90 family protein [Erwinia tracheiphila]UIA94504.1 CCDC90 family protein [Erwinia tracheiphila]
MASLIFDTHKFIRRLRDAGIEEKQAEAIVEAFQESQADMQPVTKDYFDSKLKAEIESAKGDIIKWVAGLLIAQAALVATLLKLFTGA